MARMSSRIRLRGLLSSKRRIACASSTMVKRALRSAMPEVGFSRAPAQVSEEQNEKVRAIAERFAEAVD